MDIFIFKKKYFLLMNLDVRGSMFLTHAHQSYSK